jgi:hypothetical protein
MRNCKREGEGEGEGGGGGAEIGHCAAMGLQLEGIASLPVFHLERFQGPCS